MTEQKFDKDTWQTPKYLKNYLVSRFGWFDVDGAADSKNKLFPKWIGIGPAWETLTISHMIFQATM